MDGLPLSCCLSRRRVLLGAAAGVIARPGFARTASLTPDERAVHALNRLAFGPRPADAAAIQAQGPERWLQDFIDAQLAPERIALPERLTQRLAALDTLPLTADELMARYREGQRLAREAKREGAVVGDARRELVQPIAQQARAQRLLRAIDSPAQLQELLVDFWFNHFNVFAGKGAVAVLVGDYELRAIRPHVLGSFRAMLGASAKHPAMLIYLDNAQSVGGPAARAGRGLNENYARELMELHTLGVDGGYAQRDVTELARMLTGWTSGPDAEFRFEPRRHDAGTKQWLGRKIAPAGQAEGEQALDVLAAHPATARHIAGQLAQAFVADEPPLALVQRMAERFLATQSRPDQLGQVMRTMITSDEFWRRETWGAKFKTPYQYLLSSLRAVDAPLPEDMQPLLGALAQAGMPLYGAQTPDGYKNTAAAWMNAEALAQRIQLAQTLNQRLRRSGLGADPGALLATLGPAISAGTRETVAAEPVALQLALLLGSPDFMHR
ncbi:DUF1800 domain-containing protein [Paucibacter sp. R3-3]|uniref:DUF1800 domain-containing protein n=1 Tax=Roseateles agri TaxID=3098619 RepID=A0ABU5DFJ3_9BURK|nr:DUF1800 domain-containing protein [Paucibacter sp. R3-3]MDY0745054.1 DUF1800 domain-containing protein [Paucibacter sp. R3-3]